jgi:hypothetical protein
MNVSEKIALASLVFTIVTTICVVYLAYAALAQTVRPNLTVSLLSRRHLQADEVSMHVFEVINIGRWYGSPMAVDVTVYCDFPPEFQLRELRYGSTQEHVNVEVKTGKRGTRYLKARGIKLSRHLHGEEIHVIAQAPSLPGTYRVRLSGYSANGASFTKNFDVEVS